MRTSLVLPLLLRYWNSDLKNVGEVQFASVLKSVIAFLLIRRAATGNTAGIDGDFRAVMAPSEDGVQAGNLATARVPDKIMPFFHLEN